MRGVEREEGKIEAHPFFFSNSISVSTREQTQAWSSENAILITGPPGNSQATFLQLVPLNNGKLAKFFVLFFFSYLCITYALIHPAIPLFPLGLLRPNLIQEPGDPSICPKGHFPKENVNKNCVLHREPRMERKYVC